MIMYLEITRNTQNMEITLNIVEIWNIKYVKYLKIKSKDQNFEYEN